MALGYGGNPYGPAGTENRVVKALGQCLGRQVLVFNCDEEFNFRHGENFVGLMRCELGCFDEFNRLKRMSSAISRKSNKFRLH